MSTVPSLHGYCSPSHKYTNQLSYEWIAKFLWICNIKDLYCLLVQIDFLLYMFKWLIPEITANAIGNNLRILCACILRAGTWRTVWTPTVYRTTLHSLLTLVCQEEFPCQCKPGTLYQGHLLLPHPPWLCRIEIIMKNIQTTVYIETWACPLGPPYNEFGYNKSVSLYLITEPVLLKQTRHLIRVLLVEMQIFISCNLLLTVQIVWRDYFKSPCRYISRVQTRNSRCIFTQRPYTWPIILELNVTGSYYRSEQHVQQPSYCTGK